MKEQRRVFQKINKINEKTELSDIQKVEFATFADPKTQVKRVEDLNALALEHANRIYRAKQDAKKPLQEARSKSDMALAELQSDLQEFIKRVKLLGIDPNELPQTKDYNKAISRVKALVKNIEKMFQENRS